MKDVLCVVFCAFTLSFGSGVPQHTRTHESENAARPMKMVRHKNIEEKCENVEEKHTHNHPLTNGSFTSETGPIVLLQNKPFVFQSFSLPQSRSYTFTSCWNYRDYEMST